MKTHKEQIEVVVFENGDMLVAESPIQGIYIVVWTDGIIVEYTEEEMWERYNYESCEV